MTDVRFKRKPAADWDSNYVLASGRPGFESDTGKLKIGDGVSKWSELSYLVREVDFDGLDADGSSGPPGVLDGGTV